LRSLDAIATTISCHRGQEIFSQGDLVEYWYRVMSGAAKIAVIQRNGKRQIIDLLLPGDFFGVDSTVEVEFAFEAIVEDTVVARYPRRWIEDLADSDPQIAREVRILASRPCRAYRGSCSFWAGRRPPKRSVPFS
jgi:CRP/FNR family nitrogen fixation transcriptional regulator